ncbi:MAG: type VI secretion system tube protein Hcp [Candidatus Omnitrophica bacterium]|nr:type VI secretion system tube protein Hcp [Candidatus Omnitrophota bacterium]
MRNVLCRKSKQILIGSAITMALIVSSASEAMIYATAPSVAAGQLKILSWSWGETNEGTAAQGGGGIFNDLTVVMPTGIASAKLFKEFCEGTSHPEFTITTVVGAEPFGAGEQKVLKTTLTDVIISSYQTGGSSGDVVPVDTLSLNFGSIKFEVSEQAADGSVRFVRESIALANPARQSQK